MSDNKITQLPIYPNRTIEREQPVQFGEILLLERVKRIYLDELGETSLGVGVVKLVIETEQTAPELAKQLIAQANQQINDTTPPSPKETMPTMYDLPSELIGESGLPDEFHCIQADLLTETCQPTNYQTSASTCR